jgi:hypothetical protein
MLEKTTYYPGQKSNEEIVLFIRRHWLGYIRWILLIVLMITLPTVVMIILLQNESIAYTPSNKHYFIVGISSYLYFIMAIFLTTWTDWYLDVTIVTKDHLINIKQSDLFNRSVSEQNLLRVQDVSSNMVGISQTYFRYGTVYVETAGEQPNFKMENIPKPHVVASTIMRLHEELTESLNNRNEFDNKFTTTHAKDDYIDTNNYDQQLELENENMAKHTVNTGEEKIITIQNPQSPKDDYSKNKKSYLKRSQIDSPVSDGDDKVVSITNRAVPRKKFSPRIVKKSIEKDDSYIHNTNKFDTSLDGELKEGEEVRFD